jgi:hypothetical protein
MLQPIFKPTYFDVSGELKSRTLMGEIRGLETTERLAVLLAALAPNEAIIVDATNSLIFDYDFSGHAFAPFFESTAGDPPAQHLIFRISSPDRPAFFNGILKRLQKPLRKYAESQEAFVSAGLFCKLAEHKHGPIEYIGDISPDQRRVLHTIDRSGGGTLDDLRMTTKLMPEDLFHCLEILVKRGLLMRVINGEHRYHSFCLFLTGNK